MQIVPNLMVEDLARSLAFYTSVLGMRVTMTVDAERNFAEGEALPGAVFATLDLDGAMLMLQERGSLAADVALFEDVQLTPAGTIYFRGGDPDAVAGKAGPESIVKAPEVQWYGMREVYLCDPDGHVLCVGSPAGAPPDCD